MSQGLDEPFYFHLFALRHHPPTFKVTIMKRAILLFLALEISLFLMCKVVRHHHHLLPERCHPPKEKPCAHWQSPPNLLPPPQPMATTDTLAVSMHLPSVDTPCKWDQTLWPCIPGFSRAASCFQGPPHAVVSIISPSFMFMAEEYYGILLYPHSSPVRKTVVVMPRLLMRKLPHRDVK